MVGRFAGWIGEGIASGAMSGAIKGAGGGAAIGAATGGAGSILNPDQSFIGGVGKGALIGGAIGGIGGGAASRYLDTSPRAIDRINNSSVEKFGGIHKISKKDFKKATKRSDQMIRQRQKHAKQFNREIGNTGISRGVAGLAGASAVAGGGIGLFGSSNKRHTRVRSNSIPAGF